VDTQPLPVLDDPPAVGGVLGIGLEQFGARVQHPAGLLQVLHDLSREAVAAVPAVQGAGVIIHFRGAPFTVAHTGSWVPALTDRECENRDGPALRALRTQHVVAAGRGDLLAGWPALAEAVDGAGVSAVHAAPFRVNLHPVGVLALYSTGVDVIDPPAERLGLITGLLTAAVGGYCAAHPHEDHAMRLQKELHHRHLVARATGILMGRHRVTQDEARRMLDDHATSGKVTVLTAARAIIRHHT